MGKSSIEWTATFHPDGRVTPGYSVNPIIAFNIETGKRGWFCTHASEGCRHCYAEAINRRFGNGLAYTAQNLSKVRFELKTNELESVLRKKEPAKIFTCDMTDIFHEAISDDILNRLFTILESQDRHIIQILTKRAERAAKYLGWRWGEGRIPKRNIWIGVSCEDQKTANERIPQLLQTPAAVRFISAEPLLGPIDLRHVKDPNPAIELPGEALTFNALSRKGGIALHDGAGLDWVIVGGESGPSARACNLNHVRSIVEQCKAASVAVFVKQVGARPYGNLLTLAGHDHPTELNIIRLTSKKGGKPEEWPEDLQVREFPHQGM
jgi:protein gp37